MLFSRKLKKISYVKLKTCDKCNIKFSICLNKYDLTQLKNSKISELDIFRREFTVFVFNYINSILKPYEITNYENMFIYMRNTIDHIVNEYGNFLYCHVKDLNEKISITKCGVMVRETNTGELRLSGAIGYPKVQIGYTIFIKNLHLQKEKVNLEVSLKIKFINPKLLDVKRSCLYKNGFDII